MTHIISNIIDLTNAPTPPRWFEFLLEPNRLHEHLETTGCDPSPTELIALFFRNIPSIPLLTTQQENSNSSSQPNAQKPTTTSTDNNNSNSTHSPPTNGHSDSTSPNQHDHNNDDNNLLEKLVVDFAPISAEHLNSQNSGASGGALNNNNSSNNDIVYIPPDSYEAKYRAKKAYALQTLAIKVASYLKWDLDAICNNLTIPIQYKLMQSLNLACSSKNCPPEVKKFSNMIYCIWFLRSAINYQLSNLQPQLNNTTIIYLSQLQQQQQAAETNALCSMGELFSPTSKQLKMCSNDLHSYIWELSCNTTADVKTENHSPKKLKSSNNKTNHPFRKVKLSIPLMDCFDSKNDQLNDWTKCEQIEPKEFIEAACYDLGRFFFFGESYKLAKNSFEMIKEPDVRKFPKLQDYLQSSIDMLSTPNNIIDKSDLEQNGGSSDIIKVEESRIEDCDFRINDKRRLTEKYLFDCMSEFSKSSANKMDADDMELEQDNQTFSNGEDCDLRIGAQSNYNQQQQQRQQQIGNNNLWQNQLPATIQEQQVFEAAKGDVFISQGDFKQAMGCFVSSLMLMTDYFRIFSKNYIDEEPYITRMIQCSISLSCFTQAVALCQMTRNLNYTIAFKQLNERVCNDCCDDIYECIWNITLLEYIINLHSKRGEVERRMKVIQLIGELELNENNPEEILREAEHVRRCKFFRIMSNKYL